MAVDRRTSAPPRSCFSLTAECTASQGNGFDTGEQVGRKSSASAVDGRQRAVAEHYRSDAMPHGFSPRPGCAE